MPVSMLVYMRWMRFIGAARGSIWWDVGAGVARGVGRAIGVAVALWIALHLVGCSPADWAAASAAGSTIGAAVDTFALVRARQIEAKSGEATRAAAQGDTLGALRALSEAQAYASAQTLEELAAVRRELAAARAMCPAAAAPKP